jgi:hypothetical protein
MIIGMNPAHAASTHPTWAEAETTNYPEFKQLLADGWEPFAVTPYNREGSSGYHQMISEKTYYPQKRVD